MRNYTLMLRGSFLKERLDNNYVTIGSTTTEGNFTLYSEYDPSTEGKITTDTIPQDVKKFQLYSRKSAI